MRNTERKGGEQCRSKTKGDRQGRELEQQMKATCSDEQSSSRGIRLAKFKRSGEEGQKWEWRNMYLAEIITKRNTVYW